MTDKIIEVLEEYFSERRNLPAFNSQEEKDKTYKELNNKFKSRLSSLLDIQKLLDGLPDKVGGEYTIELGINYRKIEGNITRVYFLNYFDFECNPYFKENIENANILNALRQLTDKLKAEGLLQ